MATQGLVSLVVNGQVKVKIVTGCDGYNAGKVAKWLKSNYLATLEDIYSFASGHFGTQSLVVMNKDNYIWKDEEELPASYWQTFDNPSWNPRWHYGSAEYTRIVRISQAGETR